MMNDEKYELLQLDLSKKPKEIIKFHNDLNLNKTFKIVGKLTPTESNIFMAIIAQVREKQSNILEFSAKDLQALVGYTKKGHKKNFVPIIQSTFDKLQSVFIKQEVERDDGTYTVRVNLFQISEINNDTLDIKIQISPAFVYLFNNFSRETQFTRFSLPQYVKIPSKYTKNLFRLLKQYRTLGKREFTVSEFREELDIPKSYGTNKISTRILSRVYTDLSPDFEQIHVIRKYAHGHKLQKYIFEWIPELKNRQDIFKDPIIADRRSEAYIKANKYMTPVQKDNALDSYYGYSKGTSKKNREKEELENTDDNKSYFSYKINLEEIPQLAKRWNNGQLKFMIGIYKKLEESKSLKLYDEKVYHLLLDEQLARNPGTKNSKVDDIEKHVHEKGKLDLYGLRTKEHGSVKTGTLLSSKGTENLLPLEEYSQDELMELINRYTTYTLEKGGNADVHVLGDATKISQELARRSSSKS